MKVLKITRQYTVGAQPTIEIQTYVWRQRISNIKLNHVNNLSEL